MERYTEDDFDPPYLCGPESMGWFKKRRLIFDNPPIDTKPFNYSITVQSYSYCFTVTREELYMSKYEKITAAQEVVNSAVAKFCEASEALRNAEEKRDEVSRGRSQLPGHWAGAVAPLVFKNDVDVYRCKLHEELDVFNKLTQNGATMNNIWFQHQLVGASLRKLVDADATYQDQQRFMDKLRPFEQAVSVARAEVIKARATLDRALENLKAVTR